MKDTSTKENICSHFQGSWQKFYSHYLQDLKQAGKEWKAKCPFHNDRNPSLSIGENGVWHCHAEKIGGDAFEFFARLNGLSTKANFADILRRIGDDFGLNGGHSSSRREGVAKSEIVSTYDYTDEQGKLLYQKVRFEPKSFRLRAPNGKGSWTWSIKNAPRVLYNLPALATAHEVLVVEGEKDVESLKQLGFVATTNDNGAGKWDDSYTEALVGKEVVIMPDNDGPGREHAKLVAEKLRGRGISVKILELPDLPEGGDVSDWIEAIGDTEAAAERLSVYIENADLYEPPKPYFSLNELLSMRFEDKRPIIADGFLPAVGSMLLSGLSGSGKSLLILEWCLLLSMGRDILDMEVPTARRVLVFSAEGDLENLKYRMNQIMQGHRITTQPNNLIFAKMDRRFDVEKHAEDIRKMIREVKAEVFILDPLSSFHTKMENDNMAMRGVMDTIRLEIAQQTGSAAIVVHHFGKGRDQSGNLIETSRGAQAIQDAIDTEIHLVRHGMTDMETPLLWLKYPKLRYRGHKNDLLVVRDKWFNHKITEEDVKCPPEKVKAVLQEMGGEANSVNKLKKRLQESVGISAGTAKKAIDKAIQGQFIFEGPRGGRNAKTLQIDKPKIVY